MVRRQHLRMLLFLFSTKHESRRVILMKVSQAESTALTYSCTCASLQRHPTTNLLRRLVTQLPAGITTCVGMTLLPTSALQSFRHRLADIGW